MRVSFALLAIIVAGCSKDSSVPHHMSPTERLTQQIEQERQSSAQAVDTYVPKVTGRIDELAAPAADILRQLPGVADVDVLVSAPKPTHRIIHLRDWHHVPLDLFALDVRQQVGRPVSDEDIEKVHQKHLLESWSRLSRDSPWLTTRPV
jgi:hypothetical protein